MSSETSPSWSRDTVVLRPELDAAEVHREHAEFVWASLQRLGAPDSELADLHQEVFVIVHRRRASFDGSSALRTWLFGICLRVVRNERRRAWWRRVRLVPAPKPEPSESEDPEASLLERDARRTLGRLLDTLDLEKRAVFVMFEIEGSSCPEIATELGLPLGTVHSRLRAARSQFAKALARWRAREERR